MTFLNAALAVGAAALVVPLVIHLLHRSRFRTVPWGAMHLLDSIVRTNRRRFRVEQLLLLLIRCAIPAVLALCLARPVLTGWQALSGDAPGSVVILLDNSYSMDAAGQGRTLFAEAVDHACEILGSLPRGSEVSVVETGGGPVPLFDRPSFDPQTVLRQVRLLGGGYGASDMAASLEAAASILSTMTHARRDLVVISDFQARDWDQMPATARRRIGQQIAGARVRPTVTLLGVGREAENNVCVESLEFTSQAVGVGQDVGLRVHLRNHGPQAYQDARVTLRIDGAPHSISQIGLPARAAAQALFACQFQKPGSHVVEAEVSVDDSLKTDNRCMAALDVLSRMPVLLVDGEPSPEPLEGETGFLAVALAPFAFGRVPSSDLVQTRTVAASGLSEQDIAGARAIVLANVPQLDDGQVKLLTEHVRAGASLLVFAGDRINVDWYNRSLYAGAGLLPMRIEAAQPSPGGQAESTRIAVQHFDHPALQVFNDRANGDLAAAAIRKWYRLLPDIAEGPQDSAAGGAARERSAPVVLARLETGDPLAVERRVGQGSVVFVATACDADWSDLPMRPFYLPLVQQLVTVTALQGAPPRNFRAGTPLVAILPGNLADAALSLAFPDNTRCAVRPVGRSLQSVVQYDRTQRPGVYTLSGPDVPPLHFVAQTDRKESDLRLLDSGRLRQIAGDLGGDVVSSAGEYVRRDSTRRHGREIWRPLLGAVLGLMFVELVLQQRFARVRP